MSSRKRFCANRVLLAPEAISLEMPSTSKPPRSAKAVLLATEEPSLLKHYTLAEDDLEHIRHRRAGVLRGGSVLGGSRTELHPLFICI